MEQQITEQTSGVRASAISMTAYALIALFLAVSGIYAVIFYSVALRTHEIGVRMALGANRAAVLRMTLAEAARVGAIGLGVGFPAALGLIRLLSSVLYGVIQADAATFVWLIVIMGASSLAAGCSRGSINDAANRIKESLWGDPEARPPGNHILTMQIRYQVLETRTAIHTDGYCVHATIDRLCRSLKACPLFMRTLNAY
jgi:ABC-type antimicrobial peptide transport system permease subunit